MLRRMSRPPRAAIIRPPQGFFIFNPGETSGKFVTVVVTGDNIDEINETYAVNLSNPTNATIAAAQGIGTHSG